MNLTQFGMFEGNAYQNVFNTVVFIGTATGGPSHIPFTLYSDTDPFEALGNTPLAHAVQASRDAGNINCMLYRINGIHGSVTITNKEGFELFTIRSLEGNEAMNALEVRLYETYLFIKEPNSDTHRIYEFAKFETVNDLVEKLNKDAYYGLTNYYGIVENEYAELTNFLEEDVEFKDLAFGGGSAESHLIIPRLPTSERQVNPQEIYPELMSRLKLDLEGSDGFYETTLSELRGSVFVPCDFYVDEYEPILDTMTKFCTYRTEQTELGVTTVLNTSPTFETYTDDESNEDLEEQLILKRDALISFSQNIEQFENHRYVEIVVGHQMNKADNQFYPFSYGYAATKALNEAGFIMTNKKIGKNLTYIDKFRKEDIAMLERSGYICIIQSIRRGYVANKAQTFVRQDNNLYRKSQYVRVMQYLIFKVKLLGEQFVGQMHNAFSLENLDTIITEELELLVLKEMIKDFNLSTFINNNTRELIINIEAQMIADVSTVNTQTTIKYPGSDF